LFGIKFHFAVHRNGRKIPHNQWFWSLQRSSGVEKQIHKIFALHYLIKHQIYRGKSVNGTVCVIIIWSLKMLFFFAKMKIKSEELKGKNSFHSISCRRKRNTLEMGGFVVYEMMFESKTSTMLNCWSWEFLKNRLWILIEKHLNFLSFIPDL
jgi:hypothetical protein